jgi:hypothetical protein
MMLEALEIETILRSIARHGLRSPATGAWPSQPLESDRWLAFLNQASGHRLEGLLLRAIEDGFPATDQQIGQLVDAHANALGSCLYLERLLVEVTGTLKAAGVTPYVVKGPALAHLVYSDPSLRQFGDIDLLVQCADWDQTCLILASAGFRRLYPEPRPGWDRRFTKGTVFQRADGGEIDLHRTFVAGPYGLRVVLNDLFADPASFELGGIEVQALGAEPRFLHACFNAALGDLNPRLVSLRDIAEILGKPSLDWQKVDELVRRWRVEAVINRAMSLTIELFGESGTPILASAANSHPSRFDCLAMSAYGKTDRYTPKLAVLALLGIHGVREKLAYLWGLLFPKYSYLEGRHSGKWSRWRYALRSLLPNRDRL